MCVPAGRGVSAAATALVLVLSGGLLAGCGAAPETLPSGSPNPSVGSSTGPSASPSGAPTSTPSVPADGVTLRSLGFSHGPLDAFSVPVGAVLTDRVDQPNAVTLVLGAPSGAQLIAYYRTALPAAGFRITADRPEASTLEFSGQGWSGVLTGTGQVTAVALRPA